jgi:hypothetical protein
MMSRITVVTLNATGMLFADDYDAPSVLFYKTKKHYVKFIISGKDPPKSL